MNAVFSTAPDPNSKRKFEKGMGWRYGLALGIALVLVAWGWDAWQLATAYADVWWGKPFLASITVLPLALVAAILGAPASAFYKWILWTLWGVAVGILATWIPLGGISALDGLLDPAVRGVPILPLTSAGSALTFLTVLFSAAMGLPVTLLHVFITEKAWDRSTEDNRLTPDGAAMLALVLPVALILGLLLDNLVNVQLRAPLLLTAHVVDIGLHAPPGTDLGDLSSRESSAYVAAAPWRGKFSEHFTQYLADFNERDFSSAPADAVFDNGLILRCSTVNYAEFIGGCVDLGAQDRAWTSAFLQTGGVNCSDCAVSISPTAAAWYAQHRSALGDLSAMTVVHHSGGVVLVAAGRVQCRLVGAEPTVIESCATQ